MNIVNVPIDQVLNWDKNPRTVKTKDLERLKFQIQTLGVYKPLIAVQENGHFVTLGGNMRLQVLKELGFKEVDLSIVDAPTETRKLEYALSDNDQVGLYDVEKLGGLLTLPEIKIELQNFKIDLATPISLPDLIDLYKVVHTPELLDNIPEQVETKCKSGDLYQLGNHRLLCGDATKKEDVEKLMNGKKADMVFTDPPYGVDYGSKNEFLNAFDKGNHIQVPITNDSMPIIDMKTFWVTCWNNMKGVMKDGVSYYICSMHSGELMMMMMTSVYESDLLLKHCLIWVKNNHVLGRSDYNYKHEPILYGWKKGTHNFYGGFQTSVLEYPKPLKSDLHPTMKPIALISNALKNSSQQGEIVLDIFAGSGSTLIACEQMNRICYTMEIDPHYCDVIIARWAQLTGLKSEKI